MTLFEREGATDPNVSVLIAERFGNWHTGLAVLFDNAIGLTRASTVAQHSQRALPIQSGAMCYRP